MLKGQAHCSAASSQCGREMTFTSLLSPHLSLTHKQTSGSYKQKSCCGVSEQRRGELQAWVPFYYVVLQCFYGFSDGNVSFYTFCQSSWNADVLHSHFSCDVLFFICHWFHTVIDVIVVFTKKSLSWNVTYETMKCFHLFVFFCSLTCSFNNNHNQFSLFVSFPSFNLDCL